MRLSYNSTTQMRRTRRCSQSCPTRTSVNLTAIHNANSTKGPMKHILPDCRNRQKCYTKKCDSLDGPDQLLQQLDSTPDVNDSIFFHHRLEYEEELLRLQCY